MDFTFCDRRSQSLQYSWSWNIHFNDMIKLFDQKLKIMCFQKDQWGCPILTSVKIWLYIEFFIKDIK